MTSNSAAMLPTAPRQRVVAWVPLSYALVALMALLPRELDLGAYLNIDEAMFWMKRSALFLDSLRAGDYAATAISTHPGVTTMWLGSAGLLLRDILFDSRLVTDQSFPTVLALTRLPLVLVHTAGVLLGYRLLRRLLSAVPAVLAAALWAADPFVIGYSRMLHVDGLATTFATLSLLAACVYWNHTRQRWMLLLSGVCAGLAILSKSPALALVPWVGLVALLATLYGDSRPETRGRSLAQSSLVSRLLSLVLPLAIWAATCAATCFALWPAFWVGSLAPFQQLRLGVIAEGAGTHVGGNFFLGREDNRPGALFYPVAMALRLTPWTLLGVLGLPLALRRTEAPGRHDLAALAGFAVLFLGAMSVFSNKLNRYLLPVFPALDILAAVGLLAIGAWVAEQIALRRNAEPGSSSIVRALAATIALLAVANAAWWHPYGEVAFNQLLGGAQAGARSFFFGTGEGMQLVARWLNEQPDITGVVTISPMVPALQPYLRRGAQAVEPRGGPMPQKAGYVVVYGRQSQRERPAPPFDQFYGRATPLHVVTIHGVNYAWIYQVPPPVARERPASFGAGIQLRGFTAGSARRGQPLTFKLVWDVAAAPPADYMLFAHLIGANGQHFAQVDLPYPTSGWQPGRYVTTDLPIALSGDMPAGQYRLSIGLYEPASGRRLALTSADALDPALDGADALLLTQFVLK